MLRRPRSIVAIALLAGVVASVAVSPATAFWKASGSGSASGTVATLPTAAQPSTSASSQSVTVTWAQSTFPGTTRIGSLTGGGYRLTRYASVGSTPIVPNAPCATTISGAGASLSCVEPGVPYGAWQYAVNAVLNTFTGAQGAKSVAISVTTAAPVLSAVTAQNPGTGQNTGDIHIGWAAVTGATGYNVYRRLAAGSFDLASPLNGATPLSSATISYSDPGSGLAQGANYHYVVRAVAGSPVVESASSNDLGADTISRPPAPTAVTVTSGGNVVGAATCGVTAGTRFVNNAGKGSVGVTATIVAPVAGETVVFSATTTTTVTTTVAAPSTSVSSTLNLASLADGTVTLTAQTKDAAGNLSTTTAAANVVVKDVVSPATPTATYHATGGSGLLGLNAHITGATECGATITAQNALVGTYTGTAAASGLYDIDVFVLALTPYNVTSTDLAGNVSAAVSAP